MNFGVFLTIIGYSLRLLINEFSFTFAIIGQACLGIGRPFIING
jgi:FLVCR family feline leukemia virus subgroup C receptor-related protein